MLKEYPYVCLYYHNSKGGIHGYKELVKDVLEKRYGYNVEPGQRLYRISYQYTDIRGFNLTVEDANEEGLVISQWLEKGWENSQYLENDLKHNFVKGDKLYLPWDFDGYNLTIEPCDQLYEDYSINEIIDESAPMSHPKKVGDHTVPDRNGIGYWYRQGGWRTMTNVYAKNIYNFVRINNQCDINDYIGEKDG